MFCMRMHTHRNAFIVEIKYQIYKKMYVERRMAYTFEFKFIFRYGLLGSERWKRVDQAIRSSLPSPDRLYNGRETLSESVYRVSVWSERSSLVNIIKHYWIDCLMFILNVKNANFEHLDNESYILYIFLFYFSF